MMTPLKHSIALLFRSFSIYGAVEDLCDEYASTMLRSGNVFESTKQTESLLESADLLDVQIRSQTNEKEQGDLLDKHKERVKSSG